MVHRFLTGQDAPPIILISSDRPSFLRILTIFTETIGSAEGHQRCRAWVDEFSRRFRICCILVLLCSDLLSKMFGLRHIRKLDLLSRSFFMRFKIHLFNFGILLHALENILEAVYSTLVLLDFLSDAADIANYSSFAIQSIPTRLFWLVHRGNYSAYKVLLFIIILNFFSNGFSLS